MLLSVNKTAASGWVESDIWSTNISKLLNQRVKWSRASCWFKNVSVLSNLNICQLIGCLEISWPSLLKALIGWNNRRRWTLNVFMFRRRILNVRPTDRSMSVCDVPVCQFTWEPLVRSRGNNRLFQNRSSGDQHRKWDVWSVLIFSDWALTSSTYNFLNEWV